ncbi:hypothetical protein [Kushneria sinocarnis]|nr:hypothetical protein [Kushneria sinocarnis]
MKPLKKRSASSSSPLDGMVTLLHDQGGAIDGRQALTQAMKALR